MGDELQMSGRLIAAARALADVSQEDLAAAAGLPLEVLRLIEGSGGAWLHSEHEAQALTHALDRFGAIIIGESDGMGAGVRLKFTRQDVRQIGRMEGEGGIAGSDDPP